MSKVVKRTYGKRENASQIESGDESQRTVENVDEDTSTGPANMKRARSVGTADSRFVAASSLLRASGQSMAATQEWDYHFVRCWVSKKI